MMNDQKSLISILLVEDNEIDYVTFKQYIDKLNQTSMTQCEISWVDSEAEALTAIYSNLFDIVFVDYSLTQGTGMDLIETAFQKNAKGPFILLTGSDDPSLYKQSSELGVYGHILKSELSPSAIDRTITYALERQRFEEDLINEKSFSTSVIQTIGSMIIGIDENLRIVKTNPAVYKTMGYNVDDLDKSHWTNFFSFQNIKEILNHLNNSPHEKLRMNITHKNGEERIIVWSVLNHQLNDSNGDLTSLILSGFDITDEEERNHAKQQVQKMNALGHLAGGVAHEINNLLQPIILSSEMMTARYPDDEKSQDYLNKILRNACSAANIVEDILIFARQDIKAAITLPLSQTIQESIAEIKDLLPKKVSITFHDTTNEGFYFETRADDMSRVLRNLCMNASHAMNDSGTITITLSKIDHDNLTLIVKDTGHGIDTQNLDNIFTPFFTTKEVGKGVGLGLPMVYNIVKGWDGDIKVESAKGTGTSFIISLPAFTQT